MNAIVDGRNARGRPRFGWMDGVKKALNDRKMDMREASEHARNRNEWRIVFVVLLCCRLPPKLGETAKVYRIE